MKTAYELALLGLTDITGCRAWDEAQDDEDDEEVPDDDLQGEEEGGEVGHQNRRHGRGPDWQLSQLENDGLAICDERGLYGVRGKLFISARICFALSRWVNDGYGLSGFISVLRRQHSSQRSADNDHHHQQAQGLEPEIEGGHLGRLLNVFHQEFRWDAALLANEGCDDAITDPRREHVRPLVYRLVCDAKRFGGGGNCPPEVFDGF